ncbi:placenta-expressed transcript 1 protein [Xenopus laevis]|uniref:Placenta-expressed transcript 1 protein n=2 Tax=Xenopus laevis TaxID=8355 RepID=A0A1L8FLY5_XENLA|nr:placenta-expressed transcript 1 protein [Xenopus laevis]OCT72578.1 hypothetical protein XELAEV_18035559mg [Xenopus laevis]
MDLKGCAAAAAALVFLGLMAMPVQSASSNVSCNILNETLSNKTNNFTIQVNPDKNFLVNRTYTVTVTLSGNGNVTVILQAHLPSNTSGSAVGTWSTTNESCNGSPLFLNLTENGSVSANWTAPDTVQSVGIYAYIKEGNDIFRVEAILVVAAPPNTTKVPDTTTPKPATTVSQITSTSVKTTSASSVIHPSSLLMALTETIGLFLITSKLLS